MQPKMHLALAFALLVAGPALAAPEFVTKEATGEAAIVDGNEVRAKKEAQDQALRSAVEQVAGVLVSADTLTQNSQLISDRIFANSAGYVRKFDLVSSRKDKGVMYVTVKAEVGAAQLDKDLVAVQALVARHGSRKMVVMLQEQAIDSKGVVSSSGVMATVLSQAFEKDGWSLIDPAFAAGKLKLNSGVALGSVEAKEIGDLTKSDYILYGTVNFRYHLGSGMGDIDPKGNPLIFYVTGEYDLSLFATDSGSLLAKVTGKFNTGDMGKKGGSAIISYERTAHDITVAHGAKVVEQVRSAAMEKLRSAEQNGGRVVMSVMGLSDYSAVQDFKKAVGGITNVRDVKPGSFGGGKAQFDLIYAGSTDDLAGALGAASFKKKKLSVTGVTANSVEVLVAK